MKSNSNQTCLSGGYCASKRRGERPQVCPLIGNKRAEMASARPNPGMTLLKLILVLNFSSLLVLSLAATDDDTAAENKVLTCEEVFSNAGLNYSSFWKGAAHGIHSLSLEEIRYFFDAEAPENNKIPTVNIDFRSEDVIHFSAPLWGYEERFESWALKIMDWFMINNKPYLYETVSISIPITGSQ